MPKYVVSRFAQSDMRGIARYTVEKWSANQAVHYVSDMRSCFQLLADSPGIGRACESIDKGLHRYECGKHVVFYRLRPDGIRVVRVLHQQMIPVKTRFDR